jgi:hypothetical protein
VIEELDNPAPRRHSASTRAPRLRHTGAYDTAIASTLGK